MDKQERLLRMMDHPEQYTDEQFQELLSDEDCRALYEVMRLSADAFAAEDARRKAGEGLKDEEWLRFEARYGQVSQANPSGRRLHRRSLRKMAAALVGVLMLSGIAVAAIRSLSPSPSPKEREVGSSSAGDSVSKSNHASLLGRGAGEEAASFTFSNVPLDEIVGEIALYYNKVVAIRSGQAHELRLYYKWDRQATLDSVIADLNHFGRVSLTIATDSIIIDE